MDPMSGDEYAWRPAISADEFLAGYCERSAISATLLLERREVKPCNCGEP